MEYKTKFNKGNIIKFEKDKVIVTTEIVGVSIFDVADLVIYYLTKDQGTVLEKNIIQ